MDMQQAAAAQGPPVGGAIARRCRTPKVPLLEVKYGGDPKELGFFLPQVWSHMEEYGEDFSSEAAKVRCVTRALEGTAAKWMVTLHNDNAPQLMNYDLFMTALRARFDSVACQILLTTLGCIPKIVSRPESSEKGGI
uniref:DUF4939 domain-containing protein n=1 Tax=Naja naja TaxID=35670 RepID=A0A8C6XI66_NAJNA